MAEPNEGTEESPLLKDNQLSSSVPILMEVVGARNLQLPQEDMCSFCAVQFGSRGIRHRTGNASPGSDPIWTVETKSLCIIPVSQIVDVDEKVRVTVWARNQGSIFTGHSSDQAIVFLGQVLMDLIAVLKNCTEKRVDIHLTDNDGRNVDKSTLTLRFRVASDDDVVFVQNLKKNGDDVADSTAAAPRQTDSGSMSDSRPLPMIVTEENERDGGFVSRIRDRAEHRNLSADEVLVKPHPDLSRPESTTVMKRTELKVEFDKPSQHWVEAGNGKLARLYLEILSCHNLPSTKHGNFLGSGTDAFVCVTFEDSMIQTPVINDETNPLWPPWSQRAFCFRVRRSSSVLYLGVFGFQTRRLLRHTPIGRVEISTANLRRDTMYDLSLNLSSSSHSIERTVTGVIRARLRLECDNERRLLLTELLPPHALYINTQKEKSLEVVRYTCCGEYGTSEELNAAVLLSYRSEIEIYLQRIVYGVSQGFLSLVFWRGQIQIGPIWLPLHSLIFFCTGLFLVEKPYMVLPVLVLVVPWYLLTMMHLRLREPYPWNRCLSLWHYVRILFLGKSIPLAKSIDGKSGWQETLARRKAWEQRMQEDQDVMRKRGAERKEMERVIDEHLPDDIQTKSFMIPIELVRLLAKIQGSIAGILRVVREVDFIVTWENSAVSFWITAVFFFNGIVLLFVPWGLVLHWTFRILFWCLCGPHMKVVDIMWTRRSNDDRHVRTLALKELDQARLQSEEAVKLKAFRSLSFGEFITQVPTMTWTPKCDQPLPTSVAYPDPRWTRPLFDAESPFIPGQHVSGVMIPRTDQELRRNSAVSKKRKKVAEQSLLPLCSTKSHNGTGGTTSEESGLVDLCWSELEDNGSLPFDHNIFLNDAALMDASSNYRRQNFFEPKRRVLKTYDEESLLTQASWGAMVDNIFDDSFPASQYSKKDEEGPA